MAQLDEFKANLLGGGASPNQYTVIITAPAIAGTFDSLKTMYLVRAASLPASNLGEIPVAFRGRSIYMAGDRADPEPWETTFINDTDFSIRNAMERWHNGINNYETALGTQFPQDYTATLTVQQKDRDDTRVLKEYQFMGAWPQSISSIELSASENDAIEEFSVTWRYEYFRIAGINF